MTLSKPAPARLPDAKIIGVRSGTAHRFDAIWVVVVNNRAFVRTWSDQPHGWYQAFLEEPLGAVQAGDRVLRVRMRKTRGERLLSSIDDASAEKYVTPGAQKYGRGFKAPRRRAQTLELLPR